MGSTAAMHVRSFVLLAVSRNTRVASARGFFPYFFSAAATESHQRTGFVPTRN
ncbi:MAG: hypothetical protein BWX64_01342 [Acidobacteria bacterium ADurb.Bin051]|nr:MAG: hypothetical protein BWX64_01342 [Acidobacteria bacterium ADurb.Bin051]